MTVPLLTTNADVVWPAPQFLDLLAGQRLIHTFVHERSGGSVVQLVAATSREGTSCVVRDLALIAARVPGLRVLLLDLDPPGNAQAAALRDQFGIATLAVEPLAGVPSTIFAHLLALGGLHVSEIRLTPNAPPPAWSKVFATLRAEFELVLIDCPAIDRSYDGIMLAPDVDTNLLVVEAERTRSAVAQNLRDRILEVGGAISGVVLNKQRHYIPDFIYRYI
jgi:Mrp family chromosome partitioning ATPase